MEDIRLVHVTVKWLHKEHGGWFKCATTNDLYFKKGCYNAYRKWTSVKLTNNKFNVTFACGATNQS